ncbi:carbohydrate sulfotransferase 10-like isoform X2 [Pomacea canaliculata]|uniref:carbohydrate sulfotransferase 10-like isoform X2 n=2 Tax=Pomacea canaliculata TaxID=400727 RepID=UPI000D731B1E|nr:carbohydrate sulfotransferase 10-like isoform X2 [Pomacea canaliculata]
MRRRSWYWSRVWVAVVVVVFVVLLNKSLRSDDIDEVVDRRNKLHPVEMVRKPRDCAITSWAEVKEAHQYPDDKDVSMEKDVVSRREHIQNMCRTHVHTGGRVSDPYIHVPSNLSMCLVPKVGCTFWKRVFFHLYGDSGKTPGQVSTPLDIDRLYVHFGGNRTPKTVSLNTQPGRDVIFNSTRVMFARDPWSRLWSAYVDKFILPDSWLDHGQNIVQLRPKLGVSGDEGPNSNHTRDAKQMFQRFVCADDITFSEFLNYAFQVSIDPHWSPIHELCDPCIFRPHVVGKMETFARDARYVLVTSGLGHLLQGLDHASHVQDELQLLTRYHFRMLEQRPLLRACLDDVSLARRLWRAFQLNGYIAPGRGFPAELLTRELQGATPSQSAALVTSLVTAAATDSAFGHAQWAAVRHRHMVAAYRAVSKDLLAAMQERFALDFDLFQYDREPADIFTVLP